MKTFYLQYKVTPQPSHEQFGLVAGADAAFWIVEKTPARAEQKAKHYLDRHHWNLSETVQAPVETTPEQYFHQDTQTSEPVLQQDVGFAHYLKAQEFGIASFFMAWSRDDKTSLRVCNRC
jgi:hypothetical protein